MLNFQQIISKLRPAGKPVIDPAVIRKAAQLYQLDLSELIAVKKFPSAVFNYQDKSFLKITPENERANEQLRQIYEWQSWLSDQLESVAPVYRSVNNRLTEQITSGEKSYTAVLLPRAIGKTITDADWTPEIFFELGRITGEMHRISKNYQPTQQDQQHGRDGEDQEEGVVLFKKTFLALMVVAVEVP